MSSLPVTTRSWLPTRQTSHDSRRERDALVGLRAVADEVAEAPASRRRPTPSMSASTAWNAGRLPCTSEISAIRAAGSLLSRVSLGMEVHRVAAAAGDRGGGGRRRGGHAAAAAAQRADRARPRSTATDYFSASQLERAEDFRDPQRLIALGGLGGERRDARADRAGAAARGCSSALDAGRSSGAAAAGAGISSSSLGRGPAAVGLCAHERARDVGLSTQDWGPGSGTSRSRPASRRCSPGSAASLALRARPPLPAPLVGAGGGASWWSSGRWRRGCSRSSIDPLFNKFDELPRGPLRTEVLELADRAGVDVGRGLPGRRQPPHDRRERVRERHRATRKRVVLYDNLVEDFPRDEVRSVVAHELGHVEAPRPAARAGLARARGARPGRSLAQRLAEASGAARGSATPPRRPGRAARRSRSRSRSSSFGLDSPSNSLSRQVEAARRRVRARARPAIRRRTSPSSAGWRSGTSPTRTRRAGSTSSCSEPIRRRSSGSGTGVAYEAER